MFPGGGQVARPRGILSVVRRHGQVLDRPIEREHSDDAGRVPDGLDAARRRRARDRRAGALAWRARPDRGEDRNHRRLSRRLVRRIFDSSVVVGVWVGFDQPAPIGRDAYGARVALPIWADFIKRTAKLLPTHDFPIPDSLHGEELCSVSYLRPVAGLPCIPSTSSPATSYPSRLCPIHRGTLAPDGATRVVEGLLRSLGSRIAGLFHRH